MLFSTDYATHHGVIADLFTATFEASEGAEEGTLIGALARDLMTQTPASDLHVMTVWDGSTVIGGAIFSRLSYPDDDRVVFVMGPVAVATNRQGQGIGQELITWSLEALREAGVDVVLTYGDPQYYGRVGFAAISQADVPAPFPLQHPEGWLGQSLSGSGLTPFQPTPRCVPAFNDPVFW